ncbi:tyrosine-protein phosphatase [Amycolatopsis sp. EV170708-02-1]|uniref:tyrosine-protein phosphatase n=1 Tax=Amycolatopsis sp. EV170708-02-1 TaxID=2919322 RepID=UPI001F0C8B2C|nr:tyrosine-protein phosphatase [Amycolatopsis sp. EV170708-02-1]UMO99513.1 tyrosine-protein phosphatase [Amycolatopsis sp. EV170708-02-1]
MTSVLTGAFNFRDTGGGPIRRGRLFRSDTLQALTRTDKELLLDRLGIEGVLDLRSSAETVGEGRAELPGVRYVNVPLRTVQSGRSNVLEEIYADHLRHDDNLSAAIEILAVLLARPVVVHCASGKDRTGIVTALALGLAGAPRELIVRDYLRSAYSLPRVIERFRSLRLPEELFRCTESTINALLDSVEDDFGGFAGWARQRGLSDETVRKLKANLLNER